VPPSIVKREILPVLKQNPDYLAISNMEQIGTSNGLPIIRQLPGPDNALGKVKFLFPNNYNIYLHDTPAKSHFGRTVRAFSHGCVRVEKPYELAKFLLRGDSSWNDKSIRKAMNLGREKWITLRRPIPVFITYFTAWIDNYGRINFRKDIYGHDQRMTERLFTKDLE
jgi:murein L,D-transpeptidase YcbB/YkuD